MRTPRRLSLSAPDSAVSPRYESSARAGMRVTLLDANLYSTFQPLLYQVATAGLNPGDVACSTGGFLRRYGAIFRRGELVAADTAARRLKLADGRELSYDYLILATGVQAAYHGITGAAGAHLRPVHPPGRHRAARSPHGRLRAAERTRRAPGHHRDRRRRHRGRAGQARSPSCARWCSPRRSPTSTRPGWTSGWSRWRPACSCRSIPSCASTPGRSSSSAALPSSWTRRSARLRPTG